GLWGARRGVELRRLEPAAPWLGFSPDGRLLAGAAGSTVHVWDVITGRPALPPAPHPADVCGLAYVAGGRLAVASLDGTLLFRDADTGAEVARCPKKVTLDSRSREVLVAGWGVAFSPDGLHAAQGGLDCKVRAWDTRTGERVLEGAGHLAHVGQVAFSPDGQRLASPGGDGSVRIWDLKTRQPVQQLRGHKSAVHAVAFAPDNKRLISGSRDT